MLELIIGIYSLYIFMKIYLSVMQIGYINLEKQKEPILMPEHRYKIAANYAIAKERLSIIESFIDYFLFLWWIYFGFAWLQSLVGIEDSVRDSILFLFGFFAINYIVTLPIDIYAKFKIDKSFGFNKMSFKDYIIDSLKSIALFIVIGGIIFGILSWIISSYGNWWLLGAITLFMVALLANVIYPTIIAPMFNKFTPLPEGELKESIEKMMAEAGLESSGIFVMDASKRDSRLNAYFGGIGKSKRVVLFDTLLEKLNNDELLAVLGHELGHYKHGDIWKNIAMMGIFIFSAFYIFGHLPQEIFTELGVVPTSGVIIALIILLFSPMGFIFTPIMSMLSRHNEYEADRYGSQKGGKDNLISALIKLVKENKAFPKSDPIYSKFYHTHPPVIERLQALGFDPSKIDFDKELPKDGIFQFLDDKQ